MPVNFFDSGLENRVQKNINTCGDITKLSAVIIASVDGDGVNFRGFTDSLRDTFSNGWASGNIVEAFNSWYEGNTLKEDNKSKLKKLRHIAIVRRLELAINELGKFPEDASHLKAGLAKLLENDLNLNDDESTALRLPHLKNAGWNAINAPGADFSFLPEFKNQIATIYFEQVLKDEKLLLIADANYEDDFNDLKVMAVGEGNALNVFLAPLKIEQFSGGINSDSIKTIRKAAGVRCLELAFAQLSIDEKNDDTASLLKKLASTPFQNPALTVEELALLGLEAEHVEVLAEKENTLSDTIKRQAAFKAVSYHLMHDALTEGQLGEIKSAAGLTALKDKLPGSCNDIKEQLTDDRQDELKGIAEGRLLSLANLEDAIHELNIDDLNAVKLQALNSLITANDVNAVKGLDLIALEAIAQSAKAVLPDEVDITQLKNKALEKVQKFIETKVTTYISDDANLNSLVELAAAQNAENYRQKLINENAAIGLENAVNENVLADDKAEALLKAARETVLSKIAEKVGTVDKTHIALLREAHGKEGANALAEYLFTNKDNLGIENLVGNTADETKRIFSNDGAIDTVKAALQENISGIEQTATATLLSSVDNNDLTAENFMAAAEKLFTTDGNNLKSATALLGNDDGQADAQVELGAIGVTAATIRELDPAEATFENTIKAFREKLATKAISKKLNDTDLAAEANRTLLAKIVNAADDDAVKTLLKDVAPAGLELNEHLADGLKAEQIKAFQKQAVNDLVKYYIGNLAANANEETVSFLNSLANAKNDAAFRQVLADGHAIFPELSREKLASEALFDATAIATLKTDIAKKLSLAKLTSRNVKLGDVFTNRAHQYLTLDTPKPLEKEALKNIARIGDIFATEKEIIAALKQIGVQDAEIANLAKQQLASNLSYILVDDDSQKDAILAKLNRDPRVVPFADANALLKISAEVNHQLNPMLEDLNLAHGDAEQKAAQKRMLSRYLFGMEPTQAQTAWLQAALDPQSQAARSKQRVLMDLLTLESAATRFVKGVATSHDGQLAITKEVIDRVTAQNARQFMRDAASTASQRAFAVANHKESFYQLHNKKMATPRQEEKIRQDGLGGFFKANKERGSDIKGLQKLAKKNQFALNRALNNEDRTYINETLGSYKELEKQIKFCRADIARRLSELEAIPAQKRDDKYYAYKDELKKRESELLDELALVEKDISRLEKINTQAIKTDKKQTIGIEGFKTTALTSEQWRTLQTDKKLTVGQEQIAFANSYNAEADDENVIAAEERDPKANVAVVVEGGKYAFTSYKTKDGDREEAPERKVGFLHEPNGTIRDVSGRFGDDNALTHNPTIAKKALIQAELFIKDRMTNRQVKGKMGKEKMKPIFIYGKDKNYQMAMVKALFALAEESGMRLEPKKIKCSKLTKDEVKALGPVVFGKSESLKNLSQGDTKLALEEGAKRIREAHVDTVREMQKQLKKVHSQAKHQLTEEAPVHSSMRPGGSSH